MTVDEVISGLEGGLGYDGGVNYITLLEVTEILFSIFSVIANIMVTIIIIGLPIIIALELMYLNLPFMQIKMDEVLISLSGLKKDAMTVTLKDAKRALVSANTLETGTSVNKVYLFIKIKAIFIATIVVGLQLFAGPIILNIVWNLVESIIVGFVSRV